MKIYADLSNLHKIFLNQLLQVTHWPQKRERICWLHSQDWRSD